MYVMWKHDLFPYKLCGKVIEKTKRGYKVEEYNGVIVKAIKIINDDTKGKLVKEMLEREYHAKRVEECHLHKRFDELVATQLLLILGT